tara:strand:+ start:13382 stop:14404 length:1023 start_codon:yes stop_codon:yes gene_type:complete
MKFLVYPNPKRRTVHRYDRVLRVDATGREEASTSENDLTRAPHTKFTFMVGISSARNGRLKTGLTSMVPNPYFGKTITVTTFKDVLSAEEAKRQHILEYKHSVPYNHYTDMPTGDILGKKELKDIPFFQTAYAVWDLKDGANVFDSEKPKDELAYYAFRESRIFANSFSELSLDSMYYIAKESENEERTASKSKVKDKAIAKLTLLEDRDDDTLVKFVKALNIPMRNVNRAQAYNIIREYLDRAGANIKQFSYIYKLWQDTATRAKFNSLVLFKDYSDYRIITNSGGTKYSWIPPREETGRQPDTITWNTKDQLIEFFINPESDWALDDMELQYKFKNRL